MFIEFNMLVCNIGIWKLELFLLLRKTFFLYKTLLLFFCKALLLFLQTHGLRLQTVQFFNGRLET